MRELLGKTRRTIYENIMHLTRQRGSPRFYAKGRYLERAGFCYRTYIEIVPEAGMLVIRATDEPTDKTVLQHKSSQLPYIDLNRKVLAEVFGDAEMVRVHVAAGEIRVTIEPTEQRIRSRSDDGSHVSMEAGCGTALEAARAAGYRAVLASESSEEAAEMLASRFPGVRFLVQPLAETLFSPAPITALFTTHLPASPVEDHPLADLAAIAFAQILKTNAHSIVLTAEPELRHSETVEALRRALERVGYEVHCDLAATEERSVAVLAAVTPQGARTTPAEWVERIRAALRSPVCAAAALATLAVPLAARAPTPHLEGRVRERVQDGRHVSAFSGGGLMDEAARLAGLESAHAVEIDPDFARAFSENHPECGVHQMSIHEAQFSRYIRRGAELLTMGVPCTPFSRNRTTTSAQTKRDYAKPATDHPLGDMTLWAFTFALKVNPSAAIVENVPGYRRSEMGALLCKAMMRIGYHVDAQVLDAGDYGCTQRRERYVMVFRTAPASAVLPTPWPPREDPPCVVRDLLDRDVPDDAWWDRESHPNRFRREARNRALGRGFKFQVSDVDRRWVRTLTAEHGNSNINEPLVPHPDRPATFRWFTLSEGRRLFGVRPDFNVGEGKVKPWVVLGQGVVVPLFQQIIRRATGRAPNEQSLAGWTRSVSAEASVGGLPLFDRS